MKMSTSDNMKAVYKPKDFGKGGAKKVAFPKVAM